MNGTFQITGWDESIYIEGEDGAKQSQAQITQSYEGDIEGSSELRYLMSYQSQTNALFVGFEVITGKVNGKSGSFALQHNGTFENGIASSQFLVVPNSGTGELINMSGLGSFESSQSGKASYTLAVTE